MRRRLPAPFVALARGSIFRFAGAIAQKLAQFVQIAVRQPPQCRAAGSFHQAQLAGAEQPAFFRNASGHILSLPKSALT
jgi:hypothetical protein